MKKFTVVSFFTENTLYEKEVIPLIETVKEKNIEFSIDKVKDLGSWEKNCCFKPTFILRKLKTLKNPLLWVDADAVILKDLSFFNSLKCDISLKIDENLKETDRSKIMSSTIFINYTNNSFLFLKKWERECFKRLKDRKKEVIDEIWDQVCLRDTVFEIKEKINIENLPEGYSYIFDSPSNLLKEEDIYILHFQASRLHRALLKKYKNSEKEKMNFLKNLSAIEMKLIRQKDEDFIKTFKKEKKSLSETFLDLVKKYQNIHLR